jgi:NIMA (never in mitosis gene a)-related kinase
VKIGDFGISKILRSSQDFAKTSVGTPYYLSPEICQGRVYDTKSDVWSVGCILYEICTFRRPFEAECLAGVVSSILTDSYEPIPSCYSPELASVVDMLLVKDADARPTIAQVLETSVV